VALASVGNGRHQPAPAGPDRYRYLPTQTGLDRHKTGTDRPGLFYDVFDKNFVLNSPNRHDILKILIKNVIKKLGPVGAGLGRSVPVVADERPQETLYKSFLIIYLTAPPFLF
jgi:hypothetical protein